MKEAAGEANMTVVAIILIALIAAIATPIVRDAMTSTGERADCMNRGGCWVNGACDENCSGNEGGNADAPAQAVEG